MSTTRPSGEIKQRLRTHKICLAMRLMHAGISIMLGLSMLKSTNEQRRQVHNYERFLDRCRRVFEDAPGVDVVSRLEYAPNINVN